MTAINKAFLSFYNGQPKDTGLTKESEKKTWVLQESHWFDRKADCIKDFQTVIKHGYDLANSWGSEVYLLKRKVMIKKYFPY